MIALKFQKEIKGASKVENHTDWIDALSMSFGTSRSITFKSSGADRTTSVANFQELTLTRNVDKASGELFYQSICGESLEKATIDLIRSDSDSHKTYMQFILTDPIITSYSIGSSGGDQATETITLNFTKVSCEYNDEGVDGSQAKGWDIVGSKKLAA